MNTRTQVLFLIVLGTFTFLVNNHVFDATLMEARNFVTAREILQNDSWLLPTMNGELRLAKPPMPTWCSAWMAQLTGSTDNLGAMRLPAGIAGIGMVLFLFLYARTRTTDGRLPFIVAAVLATSALVIQMGRNGSWDIFCHSFMVGALWCLSSGWQSNGQGYRAFAGAGLLLGLSFMSKGPVAFYAMLLPFLLATLFSGGAGAVRAHWRGGLLALGICTVLAAWWPIYIYVVHPEAAAATAEAEANAWVERHVQPPWFYLPFPFFIGLWAVFMLATFVWPFARKRLEAYAPNNYRFLLIWLLATFVLLSVIPEKKERYLLPILVPMALLAGTLLRAVIARFETGEQQLFDRWTAGIHGVLTGLLALAAPVACWVVRDQLTEVPLALLFAGVALLAVLGGITLWSWAKGRLWLLFRMNLVFVMLVVLMVLPLGPDLTYVNPLYRDIKEVRLREDVRELKWYSIGTFNLQRVYSVGRVVQPWDYPNDLEPFQHLPVAVFTEYPPSVYFKGPVLESITVDSLDVYHYHRKRENRQRYLSIVRHRQ
ncbi:MAG: glycosyltransferase family 39 protein [Bacteroidota bacterium]